MILSISAFLVAGIFAGLSMAQRQYDSFGTGAQGFGKYYGEHSQIKQLAHHDEAYSSCFSIRTLVIS